MAYSRSAQLAQKREALQMKAAGQRHDLVLRAREVHQCLSRIDEKLLPIQRFCSSPFGKSCTGLLTSLLPQRLVKLATPPAFVTETARKLLQFLPNFRP